jgi:hypothetical protein
VLSRITVRLDPAITKPKNWFRGVELHEPVVPPAEDTDTDPEAAN